MVLKKDETDLNVIFTALCDSNSKERSRALARLKTISSELSTEDFVKTKETLEKSSLSESNAKLKKRIDYLVENYYSKEEPEIIEMAEIIEMGEPEHLEFELGAPVRKKAPKKRHISESALIRENSFRFMHSNRRFPFHTLYIDFIRILAGLFFSLFTILALHSLWWSRFPEFFIFMVAAIVGTFSILLSSEIIRFILDFHDSNYTNTKVRIKTLEVLEKINENLKK
jgi:hypothetical protein